MSQEASTGTSQTPDQGSTPTVLWRPAKAPENGNYPGFEPGKSVVDGIRIERDVAVTMRDGVVIYADIYRPDGAVDVPALIAWGNYGKRGGIWTFDMFPGRAGVPEEATNEWTKFEGPNPKWWCRQGYAIVNPDARGSWKSEGDMATIGGQEAEDCYDLIEWLAQRPWCNGKVGMTGSSWLGMSQWFLAALRPPHLAAISPWEGWSDTYRETVAVGGIVNKPNAMEWLWEPTFGEGQVEDVPAMAVANPLWNEYWESKSAKLDRIDVPAYVVASWTHYLHARGTFEGYKQIASEHKWLRVHNTMEWPDYYTPENMEELRRFYDRYLKGIDNGWESTPRVRLAVLDGSDTAEFRDEESWPLERTVHEALYLDVANGLLRTDPAPDEQHLAYDPANEHPTFSIQFTEDVELTGHMSLRVWVEARGADDIDLYVQADKIDRAGERVGYTMLGGPVWPASHGALRASHRELDPARSTPGQPWHPHTSRQPLEPGEVVPLDIEFWPIGLLLHPGEELRITIGGTPLAPRLTPPPTPEPGAMSHVLWSGGQYDSHLLIPRTPRSIH